MTLLVKSRGGGVITKVHVSGLALKYLGSRQPFEGATGSWLGYACPAATTAAVPEPSAASGEKIK